ncbi:MAG: triose-phosphate isomerase [Endomicrobia bacterium]|nr:triose-phosphate isomerase [Endomicrobiia bacterium]MCX7940929.1 triose-phosphate isomerase [Endomicrobiia bacterium]MDW8055671.1 triose-phosphate isomerase [Elusimicrobiota bacterium]
MRKPLIAANWKMHKIISEIEDYIRKFISLVDKNFDREIVLCVPFTGLYIAGKLLFGSNIKLGAQNMYIEEKGAYTGEISPVMLKDVGCNYVILGHSERRKYFNETDEFVNKKVLTAIKFGLIPIVCIGETLQEREQNKTFEVLERQVRGSLANLNTLDAEKIVIAYEPVWAIGTGKNATPQQAQEAQQFIRQKYAELYGSIVAEKVRILYGGSITPENFKGIMSQKDVDGGLVGGASLDPESFYKIVMFDK